MATLVRKKKFLFSEALLDHAETWGECKGQPRGNRDKDTDSHEKQKAHNSNKGKARDPDEGGYTSGLPGRVLDGGYAVVCRISNKHLRSGQREVLKDVKFVTSTRDCGES